MAIIKQTSLAGVAKLRQQYIQSLSGRPEPFLEELVSCAPSVYAVFHLDEICGYFCVSPKGTLLQFYVTEAYLNVAQEIFSEMLSGEYIEKALVLTRDRVALSVTLECMREVAVDSYVFEEGEHLPTISIEFEDISFRKATLRDVPAIREACGDFHDFLHYTLEGSIASGDIFVLLSGGVVLGTGVIGAKDFQPPYVDIGMCVNEAYRNRKVGSYIISLLRQECHRQGWISGASCKRENIASKKTLEKAGLISKDRILRLSF